MLQDKDIQNIDELQTLLTKPQKSIDIILDLLGYFRFSKLSKSFDTVKSRGFSVNELLNILICLPFLNKSNIYALLRSGLANLSDAQKDAYYDLKNNVSIDWRKFLKKFTDKFNSIIAQKTDHNNDAIKCLVLDDSDIEKRGKKIEKVSRIWNHVRQLSIFGFKLLVLGYYDGKSFIPVDFSIHREKGKNKKLPFGFKKSQLKKQFSKTRPVDSPAYLREKECDQSKIEMGIKMIRRAVKRLQVDYLLMDSWFTCQEMIKAALSCKTHLIGMMKMGNALYQVNQNSLSAKQILAKKPKICRCRKHKLYYVAQQANYKGTDLQLFFCRQGKNGKWHLIVTTDLKLSFLKTLEIYQIRWTIEVFFKECKQHLNLSGCQSNDFDGQIAHITICMTQYILLSLKKRIEDYETHGALFDHLVEKIFETTLWQRIWHLFILAIIEIAQIFNISPFEFVLELINHEKIQQLLKAYQQISSIDEKIPTCDTRNSNVIISET